MSEILSESLEMYLKVVHLLAEGGAEVHAKSIAEYLSVARPSVTGALRQLGDRGLVNYSPYEAVTLTKKGQSAAKGILRRFGVLTEFFVGALCLKPEQAEEVACKMEHVIPNHALNRLANYLDHLNNCPLGEIMWNEEEQSFHCKEPPNPPCAKCKQRPD